MYNMVVVKSTPQSQVAVLKKYLVKIKESREVVGLHRWGRSALDIMSS